MFVVCDPIILLPQSYPREILLHMCRRHIAQDIHCDTVNKSKEIGNNLNKYPSVQKWLNKSMVHPSTQQNTIQQFKWKKFIFFKQEECRSIQSNMERQQRYTVKSKVIT